jgi:GTP-binding protein HflX
LLHVVDAGNPHAEEQIQAVNKVLKELGCGDKPTLLVLNKIDTVADLSYLQVLQKHHPRSVSISAGRREGLDELRDAVIEMLRADFALALVETAQSNGRVLAYLSAHADIERQEYRDDKVILRCSLPRHLFHHIMEAGVKITFLDDNAPVRGDRLNDAV